MSPKVKIFQGSQSLASTKTTDGLEKEMNAWFTKNPMINVTNVLQNHSMIQNGSILTITVFYSG